MFSAHFIALWCDKTITSTEMRQLTIVADCATSNSMALKSRKAARFGDFARRAWPKKTTVTSQEA